MMSPKRVRVNRVISYLFSETYFLILSAFLFSVRDSMHAGQ